VLRREVGGAGSGSALVAARLVPGRRALGKWSRGTPTSWNRPVTTIRNRSETPSGDHHCASHSSTWAASRWQASLGVCPWPMGALSGAAMRPPGAVVTATPVGTDLPGDGRNRPLEHRGDVLLVAAGVGAEH
jgi:hypothetical protein